MKYIVMEIQKNGESVSNIVTTYDTQPIAEQAFFTAVATACVSAVPTHTIMLLSDIGATLEYRKYDHPVYYSNVDTAEQGE